MTRKRRPEGPLIAWYHRGWGERTASDQVVLRGPCGTVDVFARSPEGFFVPVLDVPAMSPVRALPARSRR